MMLKRIFSIGLATVLVTGSLVACQTSETEQSTESSSTTPVAVTTTTEAVTTLETTTEATTTELTTESTTESTTELTTTEPTTTEPTTTESTTPAFDDAVEMPEVEGEALETIDDATLKLEAGDLANGETGIYEAGLTRDGEFVDFENPETKLVDGEYYLSAHAVKYSPIYTEDGYFVGRVSVADITIGYYSIVGDEDEVVEYRMLDTTGLPKHVYRFEKSDTGAFSLTGTGMVEGDAEVIAQYEELPLSTEGKLQEVFTESGLVLRMRSLPSLEGEVIERYAPGTVLYTIDFSDAGFVLAAPADNETFGFMSKDFLYDEGTAPSPTVTPTPAPTSEASEAETTAETSAAT